jgi:hypothetical protein
MRTAHGYLRVGSEDQGKLFHQRESPAADSPFHGVAPPHRPRRRNRLAEKNAANGKIDGANRRPPFQSPDGLDGRWK